MATSSKRAKGKGSAESATDARATQPGGTTAAANAGAKATKAATDAGQPAARDLSTRRLPAAPLAPRATGSALARGRAGADEEISRPVVIPGSGRTMGRAVLPRRRRERGPRSRLVGTLVVGITLGIVASALVAVSPLAAGAQAEGASAFAAFTNTFGPQKPPSYVWYVARPGDTVDSLARQHHCQVGGIYELNGMLAGQELQIGKAYKLPTNPNYGLYFRPASSFATSSTYGTTVLGDHIWNSYAGIPPEGALCGPVPRGSGDDMRAYDLASFDLKAPNWGAYWVRGFTWYHFGVDLANPLGTPIHAAQAGEVIFANWDTGGGGWSVKINNCNHLATAYGHMEKLLVHDGQMVHAGDIIGLEGSTGNSTGPHLHFSVQWDNLAVDPMLFFGGSKYNITHYTPDV